MTKKYVIFPQYILSKNDGDKHFISAEKLMKLYNVNPKECIIWRDEDFKTGSPPKDLIWLKPRYDGNYETHR